MRFALVVFMLTFLTSVGHAQQKFTTFILLRHAEKVADGSKNPLLTEEGKKRADRLVLLLQQTSVQAIYSTHFTRTRETVAPLAKSKSLSVLEYEAFSKEEIEKMLVTYGGGTIVVCGHSNNIPWIANYLTAEKFNDFADDEYRNILIVTVSGIGQPASITWLTY
jgi:phosphohistidine phosphatase SixA